MNKFGMVFGCIALATSVAAAGVVRPMERLQKKDGVETLKVLVWNIYRSGNEVDNGTEMILEIIREADPDICVLQESYDIKGDRPKAGEWLAGELGWNQYQGESPHLCVLTRFPIKKAYNPAYYHAEWHCVGAQIDLGEERSVVAYSTWLNSADPIWGISYNKPEMPDEELLAREAKRTRQAWEIVEYLQKDGQLKSPYPVLLGGDHNCPSNLDWTEATAKATPYRRNLPLPASMAFEEYAGFSDCFRAVYPDPVAVPGYTYNPMFKNSPAKSRIDRLYVKNPKKGFVLVPISARTIPEEADFIDGKKIPLRKRSFPSDHAAVLIEFEIRDI